MYYIQVFVFILVTGCYISSIFAIISVEFYHYFGGFFIDLYVLHIKGILTEMFDLCTIYPWTSSFFF